MLLQIMCLFFRILAKDCGRKERKRNSKRERGRKRIKSTRNYVNMCKQKLNYRVDGKEWTNWTWKYPTKTSTTTATATETKKLDLSILLKNKQTLKEHGWRSILKSLAYIKSFRLPCNSIVFAVTFVLLLLPPSNDQGSFIHFYSIPMNYTLNGCKTV